jgi:hypothetical protein
MLANVAKLNPNDDELQMIRGAAAIGAALNLNTRQAFLQLEAGRVPGARSSAGNGAHRAWFYAGL